MLLDVHVLRSVPQPVEGAVLWSLNAFSALWSQCDPGLCADHISSCTMSILINTSVEGWLGFRKITCVSCLGQPLARVGTQEMVTEVTPQ